MLVSRAFIVATSAHRSGANRRLYLLAAILVLWAGFICLRLVYLQIFRYGDFEQRAQHQQPRHVLPDDAGK